MLVNIFPFWNENDVSYGKICILSSSRTRINEEEIAYFDGLSYVIGVSEIENGWTPFKPLSLGCPNDDSEEELAYDINGVPRYIGLGEH